MVVPASKRADLKKLAEIFDEKKLSFASGEVLMEKLGLEPGSVSPFGLLNDEEQEVEVFIDKDLYEADIVNFHPNINTASVEIQREMFHKYLDGLPHKINVIEV